MNSMLIVLLVGVSACMAAPGGYLGYGGLGYGGLGLGGLGYGGLLGAPYGTTTLVAAAPAVSYQKTIVTNPAVIATGPAVVAGPAYGAHAYGAIAAPAVVAAAPAVVAHAAPAAATAAVVSGPSGLIQSKQVNPGGVAVAAAPVAVGYAHTGYAYGH